MSHFLYRPHVTGPENDVTTPDIVVDRLSIFGDGEHRYLPVQRLDAGVSMQALPGDVDVSAAYLLVASGGGVLISVAAIVRGSRDPLTSADVAVARSAWRLRNVTEHFASLDLELKGSAGELSAGVSALLEPAAILRHEDNGEPALPRGVAVLCTAATTTLRVPSDVTVALSDNSLQRTLTHTVRLLSVDEDRWDERPLPRYTVGPVGDVQHYI